MPPSRKAYRDEVRLVREYLRVSATPEEDLNKLEDLRAEGTCLWLTEKKDFYEWQEGIRGRGRYFWLNGTPAAGKSVLAAHVAGHLETLNRSCSYYFFNHSDKTKSSLGELLRSLAYQMALSDAKIREKILELQQDSLSVSQTNSRTIWQKVFVEGILRVHVHQPHFWVVDALDECNNYDALFHYLARIEQSFPLRIFLTSRATPELAELFHPFAKVVLEERVSLENTMDDIKVYVEKQQWKLPIADMSARNLLVDRLVEKSKGCFLWAHLVLQDLRGASSTEDIDQILNEVPKDMDPLYKRTLETMETSSKQNRSKSLVKAILTWATCATRPLSIYEMEDALICDTEKQVLSLERVIPQTCGQLVYVDKQNRVQLVHQTARQFLTAPELESDFAIECEQAHENLARACLRYLTSHEMKEPLYRQRQRSISAITTKRSDFASYACNSFAEHLKQSNTRDGSLLELLCNFLRTNVLSWVNIIALSRDLRPIISTAHNLRSYVDSKAGREHGAVTSLCTGWAIDLLRLVARFGKNLISAPESIHFLIPPLCPPSSAIYRIFGELPQGLAVKGLSAQNWDDRLSCIDYYNDQPTAITCSDNRFAIGLTSGDVVLYYTSTYQEARRLHHGETVKILCFGHTSKILASSGKQRIKVWSSSTGDQINQTSMPQETAALAFIGDDEALMLATVKNTVATWYYKEDTTLHIRPCYDGSRAGIEQYHHVPTKALFMIELGMLAFNRRGQPTGLWDLERWSWLGFCSKGTGNVAGATALVFNPVADLNLLAVSYLDGDLVLYDLCSQQRRKSIKGIYAQILAASSDGKTLACFSSSNSIQIFDFESLRRLYAFPCREDVKELAFASDGLRLIDIREKQCNIWEPPVLLRADTSDSASVSSNEPSSDNSSATGFSADISSDQNISCISIYSEEFVVCGKEDGSVAAYHTNDSQQFNSLYRHATNIEVTSVVTDGRSIIASADASSRVLVYSTRVAGEKLAIRGSAIFDKRMGQIVECINPNPGMERIFISTSGQATTWNLNGPEKKDQSIDHEVGTSWFNHRLKETPILLSISRKYAHFVDWTSLREITVAGSALDSIDPQLQIPSSESQKQKRSFEVAARFWGLSSEGFCELPPMAFLKLINEVQEVIGTYDDQLVYLNWDKWICSVDLDDLTKCEYKRHFFIPFDWPNPNTGLLIRVTQSGDVVVSKGSELAVIQRGLGFGDPVRFEPDDASTTSQ